MKTYALLLTLPLLGSCASAQEDRVTQLIEEAIDPSSPGGAEVTPEEKEAIADAAGGINWNQVLVTIVGGLGLAFPALRLLPNRFILGNLEAKALSKAAGA